MKQISLGSVYISAKTKQYVMQVLQTKRLSYGPFSQRFEKKFSQLHDCQYGLICSSGTAALHTILAALKIRHQWKEGDEILVPAITFVATVNVVLQIGLVPILVDVEPHSFTINSELLVDKITKKTRAIIPVHPFGKPAAMKEITEIALQHKLVIIEDCCEALAASVHGKKVGSWGVAGAFSTYSAHLLATGVGGVITTNDGQLNDLMRSLINHGRSTNYISIDDDDVVSSSQLSTLVQSRFRFNHVGFSYRLSEFEAAVGVSQLEALNQILKKRQKNTQFLLAALSDLHNCLQLPQQEKDQASTLLAFPVVLTKQALANRSWQLNNFMLHLESNGIETRQLLPILGQPAYRELKFEQDTLPVAMHCNSAGCYFGIHQALSLADLKYVSNIIHNFFT
ncbi:MAG: hypothetical protein A2632_02170 [Candidatus Pacebacteria bacterium RIFCSPHIGHO2_01_FULL_46_16]|nr:MAG: hypothetical protein A2632_02170 [Candidatus Pacebacteria bacterium RIFCSPHIGHO2_01_FULL_46_16]OGJ38193.1 MAG: hypothetical protein A3A82_01130 [Candidatus Pacebacteria bacterium RIFCSPLOWO2_01_FULL_47_12]